MMTPRAQSVVKIPNATAAAVAGSSVSYLVAGPLHRLESPARNALTGCVG
jgi:hypothetical protein